MRGNQATTKAIILSRVNYGEADRIITLLTPDSGKLSLIAKGVRRIKSKNSGGIELFSTSSVTYIKGKGDIGTLISSRLEVNYGNISKDINRTMFGYECIERLHKATEDECESDYFDLLVKLFDSLNDETLNMAIIKAWFTVQLLRLGGHAPNTGTDIAGNVFNQNQTYSFSIDDMAFSVSNSGKFLPNHIKFLRLMVQHSPPALNRVQYAPEFAMRLSPLVETMYQQYIHR